MNASSKSIWARCACNGFPAACRRGLTTRWVPK